MEDYAFFANIKGPFLGNLFMQAWSSIVQKKRLAKKKWGWVRQWGEEKKTFYFLVCYSSKRTSQ